MTSRKVKILEVPVDSHQLDFSIRRICSYCKSPEEETIRFNYTHEKRIICQMCLVRAFDKILRVPK